MIKLKRKDRDFTRDILFLIVCIVICYGVMLMFSEKKSTCI